MSMSRIILNASRPATRLRTPVHCLGSVRFGAASALRQIYTTDQRFKATGFDTPSRLPEFSLEDKVVVVSGAGRGLGLVQAKALLEAGAKVYALDRLTHPSEDFPRIQAEVGEERLNYQQIDVRNVDELNSVIQNISQKEQRMDGLIAAAGIQQETPALEYKQEDAKTMFDINVIGVFMTAQAVAREMIKHGNGGSMAFIASMSGTVANKVFSPSPACALCS